MTTRGRCELHCRASAGSESGPWLLKVQWAASHNCTGRRRVGFLEVTTTKELFVYCMDNQTNSGPGGGPTHSVSTHGKGPFAGEQAPNGPLSQSALEASTNLWQAR